MNLDDTRAKLYVVTRADLPPGVQAVQGMHAALDFSVAHPDIVRQWNEISNYLCFLSCPDEPALAQLALTAQMEKIPCVRFREPDLEDELTAIALAPSIVTRQLCSHLPLALREVVQV